ncbi:MAG TPA: CDP-diacylglycerol--glycerol-3-phosphate 3-phosphatidyltransferase [Candidatus Omnitrophota bacterium]|nr:CDP-diacylglycerol--glycerol-3-phosphate 3-phosphatidyltransferase [Candidatus Omnitrophota bacterium]
MPSPDALLLPNLITYCRIIAIPLFIGLLLAGYALPSALLFLAIALTDALDGYLARKLGQESNLGKFLDPIADKVLVLSALIALVERGAVSSVPVILILARDLVVSGIRLNAAREGRVISARMWGKTKTVFQMLAVLMLILDLPFAAWALWLAVILTLVSGVDYIVRKQ